jgi:hypothetical protein
MAQEILFTGGRLDSVTPIGTPTETNTTTMFDTALSDAAIVCNGTNSFSTKLYRNNPNEALTETTVVSGDTLYLHVVSRQSSGNSSVGNVILFYGSDGYPWLSVRNPGTTGNFQMFYNTGTGPAPVWTATGTPFIAGTGATLLTYDFQITLGSPHSVTAYVNNSSLMTTTFTLANLTNIAKIEFTAVNSTATQNYSQILITRNIPTVGAKVKTIRATGAGSNSAWTGAHTNVNEAVNSDATVDTTGTPDLVQTYAMADYTPPEGYVIKSIWQWLRAKNDGATPLNLKSVLKTGGTDYVSTNLANMTIGFAPVGIKYDTNPATSGGWLSADWNASEIGYKSAA